MSAPAREGQLQIDGVRIRYRQAGGGEAVLVLHGWGASLEAMRPVIDDLARTYAVTALDLPGHGQSDPPPEPWGTAEYAAAVLKLMNALQLQRPPLVAHSFGCRIAIRLAAAHPQRVGRLVLVSSPGVRLRPTLRALGRRAIGLLGRLAGRYGGAAGRRARAWLYARVASADYRAAGPMRPTLVRVVAEDLAPLLPVVDAPALLVWGAQDAETPVAIGRKMAARLPRASLVVLEQAGHFPFVDQFEKFRLIVGRFLRAQEPVPSGGP